MVELCREELCTGCSACFAVCPQNCIQMIEDTEGFLRPQIDERRCTNCGRCVQTCPILKAPERHKRETTAFAAMHMDEQVRLNSTSGGVFTLLSKWVLEQDGFVFGAAYTGTFQVAHRCAQRLEDVEPLRTAKYAQSAIGNTYIQIKSLLEEGFYVLFSGTPCQIEGLRAYLNREYERLILVDIICHGVASPAVWQHYIDYRSIKDASGTAPAAINLRSKESGWPKYSVHFDYENSNCYSAINSEDPFLRGYVGNLYLRPSCYQCQFKGASRNSDFTLGDYWGVWSQLPEYDDSKGVSLLLLHSEKARKIWVQMSAEVKCQEIDCMKALEENTSALESSALPEARPIFMERYAVTDFSELVDEILPKPEPAPSPSLFRRALEKVKHILK